GRRPRRPAFPPPCPRVRPPAFQNRDSGAPSRSQTRRADEWLARFLHAIARVFLGNVGLKRLGRRDVGLAGGIAVLQSRQAAAVKREGKLRVDPQGRVVVGNGGIEGSHFKKDEGQAVG